MIYWLQLSIITSLTAAGIFGYMYWKCGQLASLSIVMLVLLELGYSIINKYSNWLIPIELAVLAWNIYIIMTCKSRTAQIAMGITLIAYLIYRLFFAQYLFLGIGAMIFVPATYYWYKHCCMPKQEAHEERLWGNRKYEIA